jgi:recombination protein RecA
MPLASVVRTQIETSLSQKIPSALTPVPKMIRPAAETGIEVLDEVLRGGLPVGAISEFVGPECSGRTSVAFSFLAQITRAGKVCAWIDVSDSLDPVSASSAGVDLSRLLWVRCGAHPKAVPQPMSHFALPNRYLVPPPVKKGLHGGDADHIHEARPKDSHRPLVAYYSLRHLLRAVLNLNFGCG